MPGRAGALRQPDHTILFSEVTTPEVVREVTGYPCTFSVDVRMELEFTPRFMTEASLHSSTSQRASNPALRLFQQSNKTELNFSPKHKFSEEDMYRAADEIEKEKELLIHERGISEPRLSVAPEMDIMDYCKKEWRGNTQKATCMKKGYEEVSQKFTSIRRVRGDNYCALRATLFQAMSQLAEPPPWLQDLELILLPEKLISKYTWIRQWKLGLKFDGKSEDLVEKIKDSLALLRKKWVSLAAMRTAEARQTACDELFTNEEEEYSLYEAVKFLMLNRAIELYDDKEKGKEVPFFSVLLFARDTSNDPEQLLRNHLNQVGHTGGLEQVEMFLLAYAVRHSIRVYRLSKYNTEEFVTVYPTDPPKDWPVVTLIAEDDRHYNIPVRVCEETSL